MLPSLSKMSPFQKINRAYNQTFQVDRLSIGVVIPIENYAQHSVPGMESHLERVTLVEQLGFKAVWVRDVPLHVPTFGDAGQTYDPFTYLGFLAAHTQTIALGVASIALPLHHPVHVAKSAATLDQLTGGRFILGVASGDRPEEYPALNFSFDQRGAHFRDAFAYIRNAAEPFPQLKDNHYGSLNGQMDILPKPFANKFPMLITGSSRQSIEWIAENGDGWMYYPRNFYMQEHNIKDFRNHLNKMQLPNKPFMQPLYIDLHNNDDFQPQPIHLGWRLGINALIDYVNTIKELGVNHLALNLRFNNEKIENTLERLASKLLPHFHTQTREQP